LHYCKLHKSFSWINRIDTDRGVTRLDGTSLAPPCSNLRSFGSKFIVLKKVLVTLLGLLDASRSHSEPGESCPPRYALGTEPSSESWNHICQNFWELWFVLKFFTRHYLLAQLNYLEISRASWYKNILPCCLLN